MKILGTETAREPDHLAHTIELSCKLVETFGHQTTFTKSIDEAVGIARQEQFDWILIHHINFEGIKRLREVSPNSKYLGLSGNVFPEYIALPHLVSYAYKQKMLKDYDVVVGSHDIIKVLHDLFERR